ncbi:ATP synthase subunit 5 [Mytilinidion resinicola]|uniref:ATP synthase subunit 5, mitochondrial n=1 Tax=Mytilinidion resinicola TaxID=574789 RepID=A0A6A6Y588_9PEZI|nr:ATP synthase subunit 5 [Mytilinidion resinicola]KAF2803976.1 ATP synthase subunit 5 [Mytilinidion resinicola]
MLSGRALTQAARSATGQASIAPRAAFRCYAQAAASASTRPPVAIYGIDGTYASALYTAAAKTSALDSTSKALETLAAVFKKDPKLNTVLHAPMLTASDKDQIVAELAKHVGNVDKGDIVKNFLKTLADNNRLGVLESVTDKFAVLMGAARGEVELTVTSAAPLDNKTLTRLESAISKSQYVGQGKKLKVVPKVNPDIRGGLVVEIGDRTIDLSVSSRMAKMNKMLKDTL